ncbi:MAG: dihydrodipicolinate synthase family protein [Burkholderiales bacterium]
MNYRKSEAKAASRAQFHGIWTAITTPFNSDFEVDEAGLRRNMKRIADLKIQGVFCTGVMGEFWSLTKEERKRIVEIVVEEAHARGVKVIAHTAHHSAHETVDLTRHAEEVGADFAILMNPYYPPMSEQTIYDWFQFVASRVNIGIWMFDAEFAGYGLSPELIARIADIENVCGIKLPRPVEKFAQVQKLCGQKIVMGNPSESEWLMMMRDYGQQVYQSSPVPYLCQTPGWLPMHEYTELALKGHFDEAAQASKQLDTLRPIVSKYLRDKWVNQNLIPIAYIKAWSELMGMAAGPVRPGLPQLTDQEKQTLRADLEGVGLLNRVQTAKAA